MICEACRKGYPHSAFCKANSACSDGQCGLIRNQAVPEGVDTFDEPNPIPKDTIVKGGARALGEKLGIDWETALFSEEEFARGVQVEMEHQDVTRGDPAMTGKIAWAHLKEMPDYYQKLAEMEGAPKEDKDAEETKEELSERVGEVADVVGEEEAIEMVKDAEDAAKKLEKVNTGSGLGSGGSGDANTMADFGKPYDRETALAMKGGDPLINHFFQAYRTHLTRGASPEDSYFKLLEDGADGQPAPKWFGTRDDKFRQFLILANRSDVPIPTIRLRVIGNKEGEIAADPSMTAWDLLQTAMNRMRGRLDKDVSPVEHHDHEDGGKRLPYVPSGQIDTRGMPKQEPYPGEAEQSEEYYLNLALKALNKHCTDEWHLHPPDFEGPACKDGQGALAKAESTLGAIAGSKIHEAYTVAMDGIYRLGHLTQDQRIDLSSAITSALKAFDKEIGDMGDLEIPAEDVALLMKTHSREKCMKCGQPPDVEITHAEGRARAWFCNKHLAEWKKENYDDVVSEKKIENGAVEALSRKFHEVYQEEAKRQGDVRHEDRYEDLSEEVKEFDRVLARYVLDNLKKHASHDQSTHGNGKKARRPETVKSSEHGHHAVGFGRYSHTHPTAPKRQYGRKHPFSAVESHRSEHGGKVEKHKDKMGSTAHHKTGSPQGGIAQPPQTQPAQDDVPEERVKTLTRLVKERNLNGARLRLVPGYRNQPYSVNGLDEIRQPVRLRGNVADLTAALAEGKREVEARKVDNYAVPVEVGRVNEMKIFEGDGVSPMEMVREQVAAASFEYAVATVLKQRTGWRGRDFMSDDKQQVEPENANVMGGVRSGNPNQGGHANTQIISETDVQDIAGVGQEFEQAPEGHGIAQQGSVHPPRGVQGDGRRPEFVQEHEGEAGVSVENEGMPLAPEADEDSRGAPVTPKTRRP